MIMMTGSPTQLTAATGARWSVGAARCGARVGTTRRITGPVVIIPILEPTDTAPGTTLTRESTGRPDASMVPTVGRASALATIRAPALMRAARLLTDQTAHVAQRRLIIRAPVTMRRPGRGAVFTAVGDRRRSSAATIGPTPSALPTGRVRRRALHVASKAE